LRREKFGETVLSPCCPASKICLKKKKKKRKERKRKENSFVIEKKGLWQRSQTFPLVLVFSDGLSPRYRDNWSIVWEVLAGDLIRLWDFAYLAT
jgi:hypothetical protein